MMLSRTNRRRTMRASAPGPMTADQFVAWAMARPEGSVAN